VNCSVEALSNFALFSKAYAISITPIGTNSVSTLTGYEVPGRSRNSCGIRYNE